MPNEGYIRNLKKKCEIVFSIVEYIKVKKWINNKILLFILF